jgi:hypothetical protein
VLPYQTGSIHLRERGRSLKLLLYIALELW